MVDALVCNEYNDTLLLQRHAESKRVFAGLNIVDAPLLYEVCGRCSWNIHVVKSFVFDQASCQM